MAERQSKPWYKYWWGVIIAIFIWPFFLWWFIWAKSGKKVAVKIGATVVVWVACVVALIALAAATPATPSSSTATVQTHPISTNVTKPAPKQNATVPKTNTVTAPSTKPTAVSTPTPQPTPVHTIIYQFSLMSGSMNATDQQNVGISWKDPTTGKNQIPTDIAGAIQQINAGSYSVTYHVNSVNLDNLHAGVNNYSNPDATIACTILVDNNPVSNETAPESGYADCSGNGLDSQSGT